MKQIINKSSRKAISGGTGGVGGKATSSKSGKSISGLTGGVAECATSLDQAKKFTFFDFREQIRISRDKSLDLLKEKVNGKIFKEYTFRGFRIKKEMGPLDHTPCPKKGKYFIKTLDKKEKYIKKISLKEYLERKTKVIDYIETLDTFVEKQEEKNNQENEEIEEAPSPAKKEEAEEEHDEEFEAFFVEFLNKKKNLARQRRKEAEERANKYWARLAKKKVSHINIRDTSDDSQKRPLKVNKGHIGEFSHRLERKTSKRPQTNISKKNKKPSSCKGLKDAPTTVGLKNSEEVCTFNSLSQKRESYHFINKGQPNSPLANLDFSFSSFPEMDDYSFLCESQLDILYPAESSSAAMAAHIPKEGRPHDERIQDSLLADEIQMRDKKWKGKEPANVDGFFSTELFLKSSLWKENLFYLQKKQLLIKNKIKAQTRERVKRLRDNQKKIKKSLESSIESTNLSQRFQFFSPRPLTIRIPNPNKTLNQKPYLELPKDGNHEKPLIIRIPNPNRKVSKNTETSDDIYSETEEIDIGSMEKECPFCRALLYNSETSALCCGNGKVVLPEISNPPEIIKELFTANHSRAKYFKKNIRGFNVNFAFTSLGLKLDESLRGGLNTFRIHGQIYHRIGSVLPEVGKGPQYNQIWVYDVEEQNKYRNRFMSKLDLDISTKLQMALLECNPFAKLFKSHKYNMERQNDFNLKMVIKEKPENDQRVYNAPTASEVAAILPGDGSYDFSCRDIIISGRDGNIHRISELNGSYDPLHYVLFFPNGDAGFHLDIKFQNPTAVRKNMTPSDFYKYRLVTRRVSNNLIHYGQRLFQQYLVDQYAKIEQNRLFYIRTHQKDIRADLYQGLMDAVHNNETLNDIGRRIVLPSSFTGGPRNMHQKYQDSMAIVRALGKPDFFVTFTCNPKWQEITSALFEGQNASDRPDLCSRVFNLKLKCLLKDLGSFFGQSVACIHVVEFQKRGLPHAHILLIINSQEKPRNTDDYDKWISAEIPCKKRNPKLYEIVSNCMMHGPCGKDYPNAPCMKDGKCSKGFPKDFQSRTIENSKSGYPLYRRRNNGSVVLKNGTELDNRWVVPFSPILLQKYNAHLNVEMCNSITAIKYLYKYVYKGHDRASIQLESESGQHVDEIKQYIDCRYVSASESYWRIAGFKLHGQFPSIYRLQIHLPNQQLVYFQEQDNAQDIIARQNKTMLTEWFELNKIDSLAKEFSYSEAPSNFVWNSKDKKWKRRLRQQKGVLGRLYFVSPLAGEKFYLRILLHHVKGATSFESLKSINGEICETFKQACFKRGLLKDDQEWRDSLAEAASHKTGDQLLNLFSQILIFCDPTNPLELWEEFKDQFIESALYSVSALYPQESLESARAIAVNKVLQDLQDYLEDKSKSLSDFGLPTPANGSSDIFDRNLIRYMSYNREEQKAIMESNILKLYPEQSECFNKIMDSINGNAENNLFYVDGIGGAGKTFLYSTILAAVRSSGSLALAAASSGVAALLLPGGQTGHSLFKIPLKVNEYSTCSISKQSMQAKLLKHAKVIIWDEAPMMHKHVYEALDRTLQDIKGNGKPFGGITTVFGGDIRQILAVIPKASPEEIRSSVISQSAFWPWVTIFKLSKNMRLFSDYQESFIVAKRQYADFILNIGEGKIEENINGDIRIPDQYLYQDNLESLINWVYSESNNMSSWLADRAVLTPKNEDVHLINALALEKLEGQLFELCSCDYVVGNNEQHYPIELINSLQPSGMPLHKIILKVGAPIMLLRNLDIKNGLSNGTRLIVTKIGRRVLEAEIAVGANIGQKVFIPRIKLCPSDYPISFERIQFPVQLCFSMSINKAQGQSLQRFGVYLPNPVFSHGQLYVALSRATNPENIKILILDSKKKNEQYTNLTKNVVYKNILF